MDLRNSNLASRFVLSRLPTNMIINVGGDEVFSLLVSCEQHQVIQKNERSR